MPSPRPAARIALAAALVALGATACADDSSSGTASSTTAAADASPVSRLCDPLERVAGGLLDAPDTAHKDTGDGIECIWSTADGDLVSVTFGQDRSLFDVASETMQPWDGVDVPAYQEGVLVTMLGPGDRTVDVSVVIDDQPFDEDATTTVATAALAALGDAG